jgi:hypothetical protein
LLLDTVARAAGDDDSVDVIGDERDGPVTLGRLRTMFGVDHPAWRKIRFVTTSDAGWRREVHARIARADLIILHAAPKDAGFPSWSFAPRGIGSHYWDGFMRTPLSPPATGTGLLQEVCYLHRLRRLADTIVLCSTDHHLVVDRLIAVSGISADAFTVSGDPVTPRLTATDLQLGYLRHARIGMTYEPPGPDRCSGPELIENLGRAMRTAPEHGRSASTLPWSVPDLTGSSDTPRRLPPDGELKLIAHSDVGQLLFIPEGIITELAPSAVLAASAGRNLATSGCKNCGGTVAEIFFFTQGIHPSNTGGTRPRATCQRCGEAQYL